MRTKPSPDLVGTTTRISPLELNTYHRNPRRGDVSAIAASLRAHGQYKPVCANIGTHTGRPNEVLAGNHTLTAIRNLAEANPNDKRWQAILVHWVDVDNDQAARIVVVDNRIPELGGFDTEELVSLLEGFGDNLDGLGFTDIDIEALKEVLAGPPDLDALADEHGEPLPDDFNDLLRLKVDPQIAIRWNAYRAEYDSDTAALAELLDRPR